MPITIGDAWRDGGRTVNNFDAIRLFAASLVIFSHSFEITDGTRVNEPLRRLGADLSLGECGVIIFFTVSGFLLTKSWISTPEAKGFVIRRALRIMPALICVVVLSAFVVGPILSTLSFERYFSSSEAFAYLANAAFIVNWGTLPGVFSTNPAGGGVNAPLWTLAIEISCYGLLLVLGVSGRLTYLTCCALIVACFYYLAGSIAWAPDLSAESRFFNYVFKIGALAPAFFAGAYMALRPGSIPLDARIAAACAVAIGLSVVFGAMLVVFSLCGAYLALYIAFAPLGPVRQAGAAGDFSYGLYLWGWPAQQFAVSTFPGQNWPHNLLIAVPIAFALAVASWFIVEAPALSLKPRTPMRLAMLNK